jgi:hypothetical protein
MVQHQQLPRRAVVVRYSVTRSWSQCQRRSDLMRDLLILAALSSWQPLPLALQ